MSKIYGLSQFLVDFLVCASSADLVWQQWVARNMAAMWLWRPLKSRHTTCSTVVRKGCRKQALGLDCVKWSSLPLRAFWSWLQPVQRSKTLVDAGALMWNPGKASFSCWSCKTKDSYTQQSGFRCQAKQVAPKRCRLTLPELAYTPLFHTASGGGDPNYKELVWSSFLCASGSRSWTVFGFWFSRESSQNPLNSGLGACLCQW